MKWTSQQEAAINARGSDLLVAAAAGSGKTAVLVERIVSLVREGTPIDSMLIVTFTNAAAAEMRSRIGERLAALRAEQPNNPVLQRQQLLLGGQMEDGMPVCVRDRTFRAGNSGADQGQKLCFSCGQGHVYGTFPGKIG